MDRRKSCPDQYVVPRKIAKKGKEADVPSPVIIPSLVQITSQWIRDRLHLSAVTEIVAQVPDELLEHLLNGCTPDQLSKIEIHSQRDLSQVTEDIWRNHCRSFLNVKDLDEKDDCPTWRDFYKKLMSQYEEKKLQTGKHLRDLYDEQAKEKASKKIKILSAAPVTSRTKSTFGVAFSGYSKSVSKPMGKVLKDVRKSQAALPWKKPQPVQIQKSVTTFPKPTTPTSLAPKTLHQTFPPKISSPNFPPKTSQNFPPKTSQTFPPKNTSLSFPPKNTSQTFPPKTISQSFPPKNASQTFPPKNLNHSLSKSTENSKSPSTPPKPETKSSLSITPKPSPSQTTIKKPTSSSSSSPSPSKSPQQIITKPSFLPSKKPSSQYSNTNLANPKPSQSQTTKLPLGKRPATHNSLYAAPKSLFQ